MSVVRAKFQASREASIYGEAAVRDSQGDLSVYAGVLRLDGWKALSGTAGTFRV